MVVSVSPASPFVKGKSDPSAAKLRSGDELLAINGVSVVGKRAKLVARVLMDMGGPIELTVRTQGLLIPSGPAPVSAHRSVPDAIVVKGVDFAYANSTTFADEKKEDLNQLKSTSKSSKRAAMKVLSGVDMELPPGAKVALIGHWCG